MFSAFHSVFIIFHETTLNWYRCTTREEMVKLIVAGFNYTNFRKDRFNDGNFTYYFERTKELEDYLASTARV